MPPLDEYGRPVVAPEVKDALTAALAQIPEGKRGVFLSITDQHGTRAMVGARFGQDWKIAAGGGVTWADPHPAVYVVIQGAW